MVMLLKCFRTIKLLQIEIVWKTNHNKLINQFLNLGSTENGGNGELGRYLNSKQNKQLLSGITPNGMNTYVSTAC